MYVCMYFGADALAQRYLVKCAIKIILADNDSFETWKMILNRKVGGLSSRWQIEMCTWQY